jgi:hypothetical protein
MGGDFLSGAYEPAGVHGDWLVAVATLVAALVGAGVGSAVSYLLEAARWKREEIRRRIAAVNRALFALYRYWNELLPYRQQVIDPVREKKDAWLNANASIAPIDSSERLDNGDLGFLLDVEQGDRYAQLMLQQDRFRYAAFLINEHSRALLGAHQTLSGKGVPKGAGLTDDQLAAVLGPYLMMRLQVLLDGTTEAVDECLVSFRNEFHTLRKLGETLFPKAHFIDVNFVENPPKAKK